MMNDKMVMAIAKVVGKEVETRQQSRMERTSS